MTETTEVYNTGFYQVAETDTDIVVLLYGEEIVCRIGPQPYDKCYRNNTREEQIATAREIADALEAGHQGNINQREEALKEATKCNTDTK